MRVIRTTTDSIGMGLGEQYRLSRRTSDAGYAMAGLLVALGIMGVVMSMLMPSWSTWAKREREAELIFRGEQYMHAIELYQRQFAGAYPTDVSLLVEQRFLRKAFTDPMTGAAFQILTQGSVSAAAGPAEPVAGMPGVTQQQADGRATRVDQGPVAGGTRASATPFTEAARGMNEGGGGIIGVASTSTDTSMALYNGRNRYDEWLFVYLPQTAQPGAGAGVPGARPGLGGGLGGFGQVPGQLGGAASGVGGRGGRGGRVDQEPGAEGRRPGQRPGTPSVGPGAARRP